MPKRPGKPCLPEAKRAEVLRLLNEARLPKARIARLVGCSPTTVFRLAKELGAPSKRDEIDAAFEDPEKRDAKMREIGEQTLKCVLRRIHEARDDPRAHFVFLAVAVEGCDPLKALDVFDRVFGGAGAPDPPPLTGVLA